MATGQVLFQRFYYSKSFVRHPMETTAMGCVCLASKIEEAPRRIRDVINVFHHIKRVKNGKNIQPMILDQNYINLKNQVIKCERRVLKELGFCVHVKHPHKIIVMYLQVLGFEKNQNLMQMSWNYMNDSLRTDVFVRYQPETVACACIYLSARKLRIPLPKKPAWFHIFNIDEDDIQDVSKSILRLYTRKKVKVEQLEKVVEELRKSYQEAKLKAKGLSGNNTPIGRASSGFSPNSRLSSPTKGPSPSDIKKEPVDNHNESPSNNNRVSRKEVRYSRSQSRSPSRTSSPSEKRSKKSRKKSTSRSRSRSKSYDRKLKKRAHKRKHSHSGSRSSSLSPHRNNKKTHREKLRYKSRSRSRDRSDKNKERSRSRSYDRYDHYERTHEKYYEKNYKPKKGRSRDIEHRSRVKDPRR